MGNHIRVPTTILTPVNIDGESLAYLILQETERKGILEIKEMIGDRIRRIKEWRKKDIKLLYKWTNYLPLLIVEVFLHVSIFVMYTLGLKIKSLGLKSYGYGSGGFTNLQSFGLIRNAYPPRISVANTNWVMALNASELTPGVEEGRIVVQKSFKANFVIDNRAIDLLDIQKFQKTC